jgi:hypothetical protein
LPPVLSRSTVACGAPLEAAFFDFNAAIFAFS